MIALARKSTGLFPSILSMRRTSFHAGPSGPLRDLVARAIKMPRARPALHRRGIAFQLLSFLLKRGSRRGSFPPRRRMSLGNPHHNRPIHRLLNVVVVPSSQHFKISFRQPDVLWIPILVLDRAITGTTEEQTKKQ